MSAGGMSAGGKGREESKSTNPVGIMGKKDTTVVVVCY